MKKRIGMFFLFFVGLILIFSRFLYLDRFPAGMSHDEIEYILSGKTYFLSGVDLSNTSFPNSIFQTKTGGVISFLPAVLLSPIYGIIPINQFTARLPYFVINLLTALVLYLLVKKLFKDKSLALITTIIFLINPWSFYLSRTASDTAFALLFYLLGLFYILDNSRKLFLSFFFFTLGFFAYHGAKVILIPMVLVCIFYRYFWSKSKLNLKKSTIFLISILIVFTIYFFGNRLYSESINQSRSRDILFLNNNLISSIVDADRKASLENPFKGIFINKVSISLKIFFQKYLTAFSPEILFISGDNRATYRFGQHGLFYIIDFFFIFIGLINLFKKYPNKTRFLIFLCVISPLATAISTVETSVINRSFLLLPILIIFSGNGFFVVYKFISKKIHSVISIIILFSIITISFINFLFFYLFQFPIGGQENNFFSQQIIANYVDRNQNNNIVVIDPGQRELFLEAVFFTSKNQNLILKNFVINQNYQINNVIFTSDCPKSFNPQTTYIINKSFSDCNSKKENLKSINEEQFGGPLYLIVNDSLCISFPSQPWLRFHFTKDYYLKNLDNSNFCQTWIKSFN